MLFHRDCKWISIVVAIECESAIIVRGFKICQKHISHICKIISYKFLHITYLKPKLYTKPLFIIICRGRDIFILRYRDNLTNIKVCIISKKKLQWILCACLIYQCLHGICLCRFYCVYCRMLRVFYGIFAVGCSIVVARFCVFLLFNTAPTLNLLFPFHSLNTLPNVLFALLASPHVVYRSNLSLPPLLYIFIFSLYTIFCFLSRSYLDFVSVAINLLIRRAILFYKYMNLHNGYMYLHFEIFL